MPGLNQCEHGQMARVCDRCESAAEIAALKAQLDCRTCARCYPTKVRFVHGCDSIVVCVNANRYQPAAPVQLWGMT